MRNSILMVVTLLVACGGGDGGDATRSGTDTNATVAVGEPADSSANAAAPCEMLTEAMIREYLQPGDVDITGEAGRNRRVEPVAVLPLR